MGLFRHDDEAPGGRRFQMREKLLSIGDDYWIEDEQGERAYKVDGKALRVRDTFVLEDGDGNEVAKIQERKLRVRGTMEIERDGNTLATVHKALVGIRDRYDVDIEDGEDLKARGNVVDHEYDIKRDGDVIATERPCGVPRASSPPCADEPAPRPARHARLRELGSFRVIRG